MMSLNRMILFSKLKNGLCKIVTKSQVVIKFNVTESRLHRTCRKLPENKQGSLAVDYSPG